MSDVLAKSVVKLIEQQLVITEKRPLLLGISGPQGCGKTTLCSLLKVLLNDRNSLILSLDDFYLTFQEQKQLYSATSSELWKQRGNPGSHGLSDLKRVLENVLDNKSTTAPLYDKSLHEGEGDRVHESNLVINASGLDVVIMEGWMVGFNSISEQSLKIRWLESSFASKYSWNEIVQLNSFLSLYDPIWNLFDGFIVIQAENIQNIFAWRWEQEECASKAKGKKMMTQEQVHQFVSKFMPASELFSVQQKVLATVKMNSKRQISDS